MKIAILGAGHIGLAFAKHAAKAKYDVTISNSRGADTLKSVAANLGSNVKAVDAHDIDADVVLLSVQWQQVSKAIASVPSWKGKILIDATNAVLPGFRPADFGGKPSSMVVEEMANGARVVKAFNTYTPVMLGADPHVAGGRRVIFFSGNDAAARNVVAGIIDRFGFAGIDLGRLDEGGKLQQFPGGPLPAVNFIQL
ncbi:MAG: NAD(P)-binding domain-containing protein [Cyclobacteriaceae bacterium]|nr:NAD(P)-binding domain-containing protein [Cyclobacteriaceae bacterium]